MPRVTIWIRADDYDDWSKIPNKSEWVSQAISERMVAKRTAQQMVQPLNRELGRNTVPLCKGGHPIIRGSSCMAKGCKYSIYSS